MDDRTAGTLLRELLADEPPASRIDVEKAILAAKRRRRRRAGAMLVAAAVVALVVGAAVLPGLRTSDAPVAKQPPPQNLSPAFRFNPAHLNISLDWQPDGVTRVETETNGWGQRLTLLRGRGPAFTKVATVEVWGKGQVLAGEHPNAQVADDIYGNGIPSHWVPSAAGGTLYWFWGPGAWAFLTVYDADRPLELAVKLARAVRTESETMVRVPFTVSRPAGLQLVDVLTVTGPNGQYAAELLFAKPSGWAFSEWASVNVTNDPASLAANKPYRRAVNGSILAPARELNRFGVRLAHDFVLAASMSTARPTDQPVPTLDQAGITRLGSSVRLVSNPGDQANWTASYLR
ncbi:hypothetical protein [Cryptosporangium phraense]|uniref:Uncharacterized protein n=1 Tax=Cryptosporangium phraense TaxID=2593070 RepID=A0A545AH71_9ACTN|nr:hypothetical protein [Cryptosporangium phraense]TQS40669.1 hypothetical protein FL583_33645 [Cryptosporangium phraense]